jgi:hypothetical protein
VFFDERSFPARTTKTMFKPIKEEEDTAEDIIGLHFEDEGERFLITGTSRNEDGELVVDYKNVISHRNEKPKGYVSTVQEVRQWIGQTKLTQAAAAIKPRRNGYINDLAEQMYKQIQTYDVILPQGTKDKPTSYHKVGNAKETQWFQAEAKERDGIIDFTTWTRLPQTHETQTLRRIALRAHHLYDIKRDMSAKNRVVVNGSKQTEDTYSDTTSPVASQMQLRIFLFFTAARKNRMEQLDLTNVYLHAPIKDKVYIIVPEGFSGEGEVARLDKAAYGTKQGARRCYEHSASTLKDIGMIQCEYEPCLFRYVLEEGQECFLLQYVDDSLTGTMKAVKDLKAKLKKKFKCKFQMPKDFLGMDIEHTKLGETRLSMRTSTTKMIGALDLPKETLKYPIITPGRTDKRIVRDQDPENNEKYRSHVGALNWLTMCLRYDLTYITKELSRVLQQPTKHANEIRTRDLTYAAQHKRKMRSCSLAMMPCSRSHH